MFLTNPTALIMFIEPLFYLVTYSSCVLQLTSNSWRRTCQNHSFSCGNHTLAGISIREEEVQRHVGPPVGAFYRCVTKLPVLGFQRFDLNILENSTAALRISGVMNIDDVFKYSIDNETGCIEFCLSKKIERVLRKFRTSIISTTYDISQDSPTIVVKPPIPKVLKIELKRQLNK